ncbi:hypothetical protein KX816_08335 [Sphingosinicellaceae bacterium]|nr:hypothetical protein KX816_08335 [Sphingosinicellaceae bacterium]
MTHTLTAAPETVTPLAVPDTRGTALGTPLTPATLAAMLANRRKQDNGWTPIKVAAFIEALAETCSVVKAAAYVDMSTAAAYKLRNHPDAHAFREAWDGATAPRFEELTDIAMGRVRNGVDRNRWWHGELVGVDTVYSDRLLIHMLNRCDPDRVAALRAAADAVPAPASLPMTEDFIVAAATATGALGWDPEADVDNLVYDDDLEAAMVEQRVVREAAATEAVRLRALCDASPKCEPEDTRRAEFRAAQNRVAVGEPGSGDFDRMLVEDAEFDRETDRLSRLLTLTTLGHGRPQPMKSSSADSVSSGASSGRK